MPESLNLFQQNAAPAPWMGAMAAKKHSHSVDFELGADALMASRVLVVDDEELVTTSLRNFLSLELEIDVVAFNRPTEAVGYLREHAVDLIISDFLMPDLDGIQLLTQARELQPEVPRVLLTGYADKDAAIRAINQVQLFQYVKKPWENEQLKRVITNGLERRHLMRTLSSQLDRLSATQEHLDFLKRGLIRAFA